MIGAIRSIIKTCRNYGYRRVTAELRRRWFVVNSKKVRRVMRENDLNPKRKRRYLSTTDSDLTIRFTPMSQGISRSSGPNQLRVGDITYVAISTGFVYLAVVLDAWSRKVIDYGLGRKIDTRLTSAAPNVATFPAAPRHACPFDGRRSSSHRPQSRLRSATRPRSGRR